jgi:hypothetical protein
MTGVLAALTDPSPPPIAAEPLPAATTLARAAIDGTLAAHAAAGRAIPEAAP